MNSYSEVRRVRAAMSKEAGHDVRRLIAKINERRLQVAARIIDPGTDAEAAAQKSGRQFVISMKNLCQPPGELCR